MTMKTRAIALLEKAGIIVNGSEPWDIQVHDERLYGRVFRHGSLGLGEAYMDGWWDAPRLDEFFTRIFLAGLDRQASPKRELMTELMHRIFNFQSFRRAFMVGEEHYDLGNDLFVNMLDPRLVYTCGYWEQARDLAEAQRDKLDLVCQKVRLRPGMRVLDIGCGWGGFVRYAAQRYGVSVVGVTVSKEQAKYARDVCKDLPVDIRVQDYRELDGPFDAIVSIGMFEHVGYKNYRTYMEVVRRCLEPDGLFLLHTIGNCRSVHRTDPWMEKYIFKNGMLPSLKQIFTASEGLFNVVEDVHNFGAYYDPTLMAWNENFQAAWPDLKARYSGRFKRMWEYYLLACAGSFRARRNQLWQIVFSPQGVAGGYHSVR